jgi:hypothetical protein
MPPLYNLIFELASLALGLAILIKLWRNPNKFHFIGFIVAVITTAAIELTGVREHHSYYYGDFLFTLDIAPVIVSFIGGTPRGVPLFICVDWAIIVFCLWRMGERLNVKWYLLPFVFGLFAVILDLALDPIAAGSKLVAQLGDPCESSTFLGNTEGVGYWVWCIPPPPGEFLFGVPLPNFYGWFLVISAFMYFYLIAHRYAYNSPIGTQLSTLFGITAASIALFWTLLNWFMAIDLGTSGWLLLGGLMLVGIGVLFRAGIDRKDYSVDWWALSVVVANLLFCVATYIAQLYGSLSTLLLICVSLCLLISVLLALWILIGKRLLGMPTP